MARLKIQFIKEGSNPDRLHYRRDNGTCGTEVLSPNSVSHDLAHYVVEQRLGISEGFWGMIAAGYSLVTYNLSNEERPFQISEEGYRAEFLATLLQSMAALGKLDEGYVQMLEEAAKTSGIAFPDLPPAELMEDMRQELLALYENWNAATVELSLEFSCPDQDSAS